MFSLSLPGLTWSLVPLSRGTNKTVTHNTTL